MASTSFHLGYLQLRQEEKNTVYDKLARWTRIQEVLLSKRKRYQSTMVRPIVWGGVGVRGGAMRCQNPKWGGDGLPSKSQMAQRPTKIFYFS